MRYDLIFSSSELFQHQIQHKNKIKNYTQKLQKSPPPTGGYLTLVFIGEMKKAPQAKIFVIGTVFTPKTAQKCKKNGQNKIQPPGGGGRKCIYFGNPPRPGGITEKSPPRGDLPPPKSLMTKIRIRVLPRHRKQPNRKVVICFIC